MTDSFWLAASAADALAVYTVPIDGVETRVIEAVRDAPPLVCLHGTGGHAEAFIRNLAALSRGHHVLAYDLPAHGWSGAPERSYEIDGYCRHLDAFLDAFNLPQAVLAGQSLGGWIAAAFTVSHPERVTGLVLIGAGGTRSTRPSWRGYGTPPWRPSRPRRPRWSGTESRCCSTAR